MKKSRSYYPKIKEAEKRVSHCDGCNTTVLKLQHGYQKDQESQAISITTSNNKTTIEQPESQEEYIHKKSGKIWDSKIVISEKNHPTKSKQT